MKPVIFIDNWDERQVSFHQITFEMLALAHLAGRISQQLYNRNVINASVLTINGRFSRCLRDPIQCCI